MSIVPSCRKQSTNTQNGKNYETHEQQKHQENAKILD